MAHISLKTALPGPISQAWMERRYASVARSPFHTTAIVAKRARGALIEDVDGNTLLDFGAGIAVVNTGHCEPSIVEAIRAQAEEFLHGCFNTTPHETYIQLCEELNASMPGNFAKKSFLANSGAEAVENAIKIARVATGRQAVVAFEHAFHGRTYMAMSLTGKAKPYRAGFAPFSPEVYRAPFPYVYRWSGVGERPSAEDSERVAREAMSRLDEVISTQIGADRCAAVIVEPILGEGGIVPLPTSFYRALRAYCTQHGIVLIADEIQTAMGRLGSLFYSASEGVDPDLTTLAKGLGGGMPISAVVGRADLMDAVGEGGIGGTYGGNAVCCASALATLRVLKTTPLMSRVRELGALMSSRLTQWREKYECVGDVRGAGLMQGVEFVSDRATKAPAKARAQSVARYAHERGLIVLLAGSHGNVIRLIPPLVLEIDQLKEGLDLLEAGIAAGSPS